MGEFLTKNAAYERIKFAQSKGVAPEQALRDLANAGYEVEGYNAEFSPLDTIKNAPGSLLEFGKAIWSAVSNPVQTYNALESVTKGALRTGAKAIGFQPAENEIAGTSQDEQAFEAMVDFFVDRYGSTDKLLNTIEKDPVGFLSDASIVLSGGAGAVKGIAGAAVKGAATGGKVARVAGAIGKGAEATQKYARILEPATATTKTARRLNKAVGIDKFANKLMRDLAGASKTFVKDVGKGVDPTNFLTDHGISGTLPSMSKQLEKVARLTKGRVDELLGSVTGRFRNTDTLSLLNEELKIFSKETDDVVKIIDELPGEKIPVDDLSETRISRPGQAPGGESITAQELIPIESSYKQSLIVPKPNLSQESLATFKRIKELRQKYLKEGLTLSEMNEVKRLSDETLSIYKKTIGETKASAKAEELGKLRASTQKFIENQAKDAGIPNIRELNRQTQLSRAWKDVIDERILIGRDRISLWERLTLIGGVTGAAVYGGTGPLLASLGLVGTIEASRIPLIRTFLINRISLMSKGEFKNFIGEVDAFTKTRKFGKKMREIRQEAIRYARPAGIVREKAEQERIPIQQ